MFALEPEDEIADALEERVLELCLVRELCPDLAERRAQLRLQLGVDRLRGRELVVKGLQRLVEMGALREPSRVLRSRGRIGRGGLQSRRLRCL